jgi:phosphatidylglycerol:prolipoprotein diacylglycerol transferase
VNLFINWDVTPEIIEGQKIPNLYGLLFVSGLILGYFIIKKIFKKESVEDEKLDKLVFYIVIATIVGARLGHVFFYGPYFDGIDALGNFERGYFSHPADILKVWQGGLASHGAAIAIIISLYIYSKKVLQKPIWYMLDRIVAPAAIAGFFIRMGNLVNSEIVGTPTDLPWAFSFPHYYNESLGMYDATPRHPAQLYESICYLVIFVILSYFFRKLKMYEKKGHLFAWFLIFVWGARFFVEFVKMGQTDRDYLWALNTGQLLSIPFVLFGVYLLLRKQNPSEIEV